MLQLISKHLLRGFNYIQRKFVFYINRIKLIEQKVILGKGLKLNGKVNIINNGHVQIGDNVTINSGVQSNPISQNLTSIYCSKNAKVIIGNNTGISGVTLYSSVAITIGDNVLIGADTKIYDTDFHSVSYKNRLVNDVTIKSKPVSIGDFCFIGANVTILKGVKIGRGSVIAACSLVNKDVGENEIWGGNPASKLKENINE